MTVGPSTGPGREIRFWLTPLQPCPYLPGRQAQYLVIEPGVPLHGALLQRLLDIGFRRSGTEAYRPWCPGCQACIPLRVPVADFVPNRHQRRCWQQGQRAVQLHERSAAFDPEHYHLYQRYQEARHPSGGMGGASETSYLHFLANPWGEVRFWELRLGDQLVAVAVVDLLPRGISAVYTFFDPGLAHLSPGKLAILWQIAEARRRGLAFVYLGLWVSGCRIMSYKEQYRPIDAWIDEAWQRFPRGTPIALTDPVP